MHKMQKALHLHLEEAKKNPKHLGKDYWVFEKYDGWYVTNTYIHGKWQGWESSKGREIPSLAGYDLNTCLPNAPEGAVLIAEATIPGLIFKDLNGKFNQKQVRLSDVIFYAHDIILPENRRFYQRYNILTAAVKMAGVKYLELAPILTNSDEKADWIEKYNEVLSKPNGEGIILKDPEAPYAYGSRIATLMKIKCEETLDLLVVGTAPGQGKYVGMVGHLIVESSNGVRNNVSGMSDAERQAWTDDPSQIIGQVVEVKAMKILPNGSLREGRFKAVRYNKSASQID